MAEPKGETPEPKGETPASSKGETPAGRGETPRSEFASEGSKAALLADLADARAKVKAFEDAQKTAEQRSADDLAASRKETAEARLQVLRYEVAIAKGMPVKMARRLAGSTREELEVDADDLMATLSATLEGGAGQGDPKSADPKPNGGLKTRPTEKLQAGAAPAAEAVEMDPKVLADKVPPMY